MAIVAGVKFRNAGKMYYFDPADIDISLGDNVIVETARGIEFGTVTMEPCEVSGGDIIKPLRKIIRMADEEDVKKHERNEEKKTEALAICEEKIKKHGLEMQLVDVEYTFDNNKIIFYFTADGRVDFRQLVRDLAGVFRMRIELRQIGVRDKAKMVGGIGCCGRELCCAQWMSDFRPVSIKMAKCQNLSLNPSKISGMCGRLMCCLQFENSTYQELGRNMPSAGETVITEEGKAVVTDADILAGKVKCRLIEEKPDEPPKRGGKGRKHGQDDHEEKNGRNGSKRETQLSAELYVFDKDDVKRLKKKKGGKKKRREEESPVDDELKALMDD
ncbi:MAG: stage 0 sporulation family protein [Anaerovoracaceae bacterium]|nr:stage 0 sporulation family protein [Anaerovoracaceae bacterium]